MLNWLYITVWDKPENIYYYQITVGFLYKNTDTLGLGVDVYNNDI